MHLKSFLKDEFIKLVPFQDKTIVIELLVNFLVSVEEITFVDFCYLNDDQLDRFKDMGLCEFDLSFKTVIKAYFSSCYKSEVNTQVFAGQSKFSSIYVPFFVKNHLYMVLKVGVSGRSCKKEFLDELDGISFYCSILLDRIEYASNLGEANLKLNSLNFSLEKMNKKLNSDLKLAISDFEEQASLARVISSQSSANSISKEILHEVSNPLSLIQFDLDEINRLCTGISLDKVSLDELIKIYNINSNEIYALVSKIDKYEKKEFYKELDKFSKYPLLVSVLTTLKVNSELKYCSKSSVQNIQNVSVLLETVSNFGALRVYEKEVLDTRLIVNEVVKLFEKKLKSLDIELKVSGAIGIFFVAAEKTRLYQVIINILKNSINALENVKQKCISVDLKNTPNFVSVIIVDSGPGFKQHELYYDIKESSQQSRVGLGLLVCKNILSQIGGNIVFMKQEKGMRVELKIPSIKI